MVFMVLFFEGFLLLEIDKNMELIMMSILILYYVLLLSKIINVSDMDYID